MFAAHLPSTHAKDDLALLSPRSANRGWIKPSGALGKEVQTSYAASDTTNLSANDRPAESYQATMKMYETYQASRNSANGKVSPKQKTEAAKRLTSALEHPDYKNVNLEIARELHARTVTNIASCFADSFLPSQDSKVASQLRSAIRDETALSMHGNQQKRLVEQTVEWTARGLAPKATRLTSQELTRTANTVMDYAMKQAWDDKAKQELTLRHLYQIDTNTHTPDAVMMRHIANQTRVLLHADLPIDHHARMMIKELVPMAVQMKKFPEDAKALLGPDFQPKTEPKLATGFAAYLEKANALSPNPLHTYAPKHFNSHIEALMQLDPQPLQKILQDTNTVHDYISEVTAHARKLQQGIQEASQEQKLEFIQTCDIRNQLIAIRTRLQEQAQPLQKERDNTLLNIFRDPQAVDVVLKSYSTDRLQSFTEQLQNNANSQIYLASRADQIAEDCKRRGLPPIYMPGTSQEIPLAEMAQNSRTAAENWSTASKMVSEELKKRLDKK